MLILFVTFLGLCKYATETKNMIIKQSTINIVVSITFLIIAVLLGGS